MARSPSVYGLVILLFLHIDGTQERMGYQARSHPEQGPVALGQTRAPGSEDLHSSERTILA